MFEIFLGKKVKITKYGADGEEESYNLKVLEVEGSIIKIEDIKGNIQVINMTSPLYAKIKLQEQS